MEAYRVETLGIPHFQDIDGGEVVSLTQQSNFTRQKDSWY
jgi:hypothetical protein